MMRFWVKCNLVLLTIILSTYSLFGAEKEASSIRTIAIIEVDGETMPGWEQQIIDRYCDEEGHAMPVVFRGAAKNWEAAAWTPEYFLENFGDEEVITSAMDSQEVIGESLYTTIKDHINDILLNPKMRLILLAQ